MPDYHALQTLCDDVSRYLENVAMDESRGTPERELKLAEQETMKLLRGIIAAQVEIEQRTAGR